MTEISGHGTPTVNIDGGITITLEGGGTIDLTFASAAHPFDGGIVVGTPDAFFVAQLLMLVAGYLAPRHYIEGVVQLTPEDQERFQRQFHGLFDRAT